MNAKEIMQCVTNLRDWMKSLDIDLYHIPSSDSFLNEYTPTHNCPRYFVTGFTGSVAQVLVPIKGDVILFVDGRYTEQAKNEVPSFVKTIITPLGTSLESAMLEKIKELAPNHLAAMSNRISYELASELSEITYVSYFGEGEVEALLGINYAPDNNEIESLDLKLSGKSTEDKLSDIFKDCELDAIYISALDSIAWLANGRGYQFPYMSSFAAKAIATKKELHLFVDAKLVKESDGVTFYHSFEDFPRFKSFGKLGVHTPTLTYSDYLVLKKKNELIEHNGIVSFQSIKNETEKEQFRIAFKKSDKAMYKAISWLKKTGNERNVSELEFNKKVRSSYEEAGAKGLSFSPITGFGANGSIIHYSSPKDQVYAKNNELNLLDSGAYYEAGLATDCTRTFCLNETNDEKLKEIYTAVLKGLIRLHLAVFPEGTWGATLDGYARSFMRTLGYDYAHGTGHGVGAHVHEGGVRINVNSSLSMKEGQVVSLEPGIYLEGIGGVRLENIAIVKKHDEFPHMLCFEPLVYLGFESSLIKFEYLDVAEKKFLKEYEEECIRRQTNF